MFYGVCGGAQKPAQVCGGPKGTGHPRDTAKHRLAIFTIISHCCVERERQTDRDREIERERAVVNIVSL